MANAVRMGQAFVEMSLKDSAFRQSLMAISKRLRAVGGQMQRVGGIASAAGAAITAPFAASLKVFANYGDTLDKMAGRTGFSVEALSQLGFAAEQSGKDLGTIERGAKGMARSLYSLEQGSTAAVDAFGALGLSMDDLAGKAPEDQFTLIADRLSQIEDPTRRAGVAMQVFGKAGTDLLPLFANGAAGISGLRDEAHRLGLTMSSEDTTAAAAFTDALNRLMKQSRAVFMQLGAAIAGPLTDFLALTVPILTATIQWMSANRQLLMTIAAIGAGLVAAGSALVGLGTAFQVIGFAAAGLSGAIGVVGTALAAIISPVGLVATGIAAAAAAFLAFTDTGRQMVGNLISWFTELKDTTLRTFAAISSALAAGDIQAAANVLWAGLKLLWLQGTASLREAWHNLVGTIVEVWFSAWAGVQQLANQVMTGIGNTWDRIVFGMLKAWHTTVASVQKGWAWIKSVFMSIGPTIEKVWHGTIATLQKGWAWIKSVFDSSVDYAAEVAAINEELARKSGSADAALGAVNAEYTTQVDSIDAQLAADTGAADSALQARIDERNAAADQRLEQIGAELAANLQGNDDATQAAIAAAEKQLEDAKAAFATAEQAALANGEAATAQQQLVEAAASTPELAGPAGGQMAQGVFSSAALGALQQPSGAEEKTARNTERTARATEEMARALNTGMAFT